MISTLRDELTQRCHEIIELEAALSSLNQQVKLSVPGFRSVGTMEKAGGQRAGPRREKKRGRPPARVFRRSSPLTERLEQAT